MNPDDDGDLAERALAAEARGDIPTAIESLEQLVTRAEEAPLITWLGTCYLRTQQFGAARAAFERALALDPNYAQAQTGLGELCDELGLLAEAESWYSRAVGSEAKPERLILLGDIQLQRDDPEAAAVSFRRAFELEPTNEEAVAGLVATLRYQPKQHVDQLLRDALAVHAADPVLHRELAFELLGSKQKAEALKELETSLKAEPTETWTHLYLSLYWLWAGDLPRAVEAAEEGAVLRPMWRLPTWFAQLLRERLDPSQNVATVAPQSNLASTEVYATLHLAFGLQKVGRDDLASVLMAAARSIAPKHPLLKYIAAGGRSEAS